MPTGDTHSSTPDSELMDQVRQNQPEAMAELVRRHQQPLLNFFHRMGAYTDTEDLVQETFIRVYNYRARYRATARFTTFLYTVARNVWIDLLRKRRRREALRKRFEQEAETAHDGNMGRMRAGLDAQEALARLPDKLKSVVVLSLYQGLRYDEIAEVLDIPPGTVKSRMFLALNRLREEFDERKTEADRD